MRRQIILAIVVVVVSVLATPPQTSATSSLLVAVTTNFIEPFKEIAALFEARTRIRAEPVFSSQGKLYAQIVEGAPYDMFLSADEMRPEDLYRKGLSDKPFVYATGAVVLWTARKDLCAELDWKAVITRPDVKTVAIANPESAAYGASSMETLVGTGLWNSLQSKYVYAQTVAQAFQYASTGSVDVGFCALSSALSAQGSRGCHLVVEEAPPVVQAACVMNRSKNRAAAEIFSEFLFSPEAEKVKKGYGYR